MTIRDSITEFPVEQVWGLPQLLWSVGYRWRRMRSQKLPAALATIESRSFLRFSSNAGWLCVSYSYTVGEDVFSREVRKWWVSKVSSRAETDPVTVELSRQFPPGSRLQVRIDSDCAARSVMDVYV